METIHNRWKQHLILLTAPLLTVIDVFIVNIAIPSIKQSFHASNSEVELVIASYLLGFASFQITGSRAGDIYGRKKIFLWGMAFFVIASCACGMATNVEILIFARLLQGISGAFMMPQSLAYVQILFPEPQERTKAIGYVGITLGIASVLGQFLGGLFSGMNNLPIAGWRFIFFINLPIGVIAFITAIKYLINTKQNAQQKFDFSGVILFTLALASLIIPLTEGREKGYPIWSFGLLGLSIILFIVFVINQNKNLKNDSHPLIDLRLFKIKDFSLGLLLLLFYFGMHTSYLLVSTVYFQNGLNKSSFQTGIYFSIWGLSFMIASIISIKLVNIYGKKPIQIALISMIVIYIVQYLYFNQETTDLTIFWNLPLLGLCGGMIIPSLINVALKDVPTEYAGIASGTYSTVQQTASSIGICIVGGIFFNSIAKTQNVVQAFHLSLFAEILCLIIGSIILYKVSDFKKAK